MDYLSSVVLRDCGTRSASVFFTTSSQKRLRIPAALALVSEGTTANPQKLHFSFRLRWPEFLGQCFLAVFAQSFCVVCCYLPSSLFSGLIRITSPFFLRERPLCCDAGLCLMPQEWANKYFGIGKTKMGWQKTNIAAAGHLYDAIFWPFKDRIVSVRIRDVIALGLQRGK